MFLKCQILKNWDTAELVSERLLLKHGDNPDKGVKINGIQVDLLKDLEENISNDRFTNIKHEFSESKSQKVGQL